MGVPPPPSSEGCSDDGSVGRRASRRPARYGSSESEAGARGAVWAPRAPHAAPARVATDDAEAAALLLEIAHPIKRMKIEAREEGRRGRGGGGAGAARHLACGAAPSPSRRPAHSPPPQPDDEPGPVFTCATCAGRVYLRGSTRPAFFCAACPSASRAQVRRATARLGNAPVSAAEASALLVAAEAAAWAAGRTAAETATATALRAESAPVAAATPPTAPEPPRRAASDPVFNAGDDPSASLETGGRCKCGRRVSADHPPCKSGVALLCDALASRYGGLGGGGEGGAKAEAGADAPPPSLPILKLDLLAPALGVPRRRLYDVVNVLEAVDIVSRAGRLAYAWRGDAGLARTLARLAADQAAGAPVDESGRRGGGAAGRAARAAAAGGDGGGAGAGPAPQSLWGLATKFVRLLLEAGTALPLPDAAAAIVGDGGDDRDGAPWTPDALHRARVTAERRLYDVGSVLASAGVVRRRGHGGRAPEFEWAPAWRAAAADAVASAREGATPLSPAARSLSPDLALRLGRLEAPRAAAAAAVG